MVVQSRHFNGFQKSVDNNIPSVRMRCLYFPFNFCLSYIVQNYTNVYTSWFAIEFYITCLRECPLLVEQQNSNPIECSCHQNLIFI